MNSLRQAFKDEIKLSDYLSKIWWTSVIYALVMCGLTVWHDDQIALGYLFPTDWKWHAHDIRGGLYVETWCTIVINAFQVGLGVWGGLLLGLGIKRILTGHKYFFGCFSLGLTFCGFAYFLPMMAQPFFQMLADRMPYLMK